MGEFKIGQEVEIQEGYDMNSPLTGNIIEVKKGDKGIINGRGMVYLTTGEGRGKLHKVCDKEEIKGYDYGNIAKKVLNRLIGEYGLDEFLDGYDIPKEELIYSIEEELKDIF